LAEILIDIATVIALLGVFVAAIRFVVGPLAADRAVALDTLTIISISLIVLIALTSGRVIYLDVAMVYGVLSFIGILAIARYLEGGL
jgi:multicomponent Na+:H+ antiporter subunit F